MSSDPEKRHSDDKYTVGITSSGSLPSYEEAAVTTGAPVEKISPLGYHVDWLTVIFLVRIPRSHDFPSTDLSIPHRILERWLELESFLHVNFKPFVSLSKAINICSWIDS